MSIMVVEAEGAAVVEEEGAAVVVDIPAASLPTLVVVVVEPLDPAVTVEVSDPHAALDNAMDTAIPAMARRFIRSP
jgi:hypothetical protein